jgi:hypothetical protein
MSDWNYEFGQTVVGIETETVSASSLAVYFIHTPLISVVDNLTNADMTDTAVTLEVQVALSDTEPLLWFDAAWEAYQGVTHATLVDGSSSVVPAYYVVISVGPGATLGPQLAESMNVWIKTNGEVYQAGSIKFF